MDATTGSEPWWRHNFDDVYYDLHAPLFPEHESRRQVAAMLEMLGLPAGSRVLDVPCGWGRHSNLLRQAGLDAVGVDLSVAFLHRAAASAETTNSRGTATAPFAAADIRRLPFPAHTFDGVVDVFTSVGLFDDPQDDLAALTELSRVLVPSGRLLLETMHRDDVLAHYTPEDAWTLPDGTEVSVRREYDPETHVSHEVMRWQRPSAAARGAMPSTSAAAQGAMPSTRAAAAGPAAGPAPGASEHGGATDITSTPIRGEKHHSLRLYSAGEVRDLVERAGLNVRATYGDWSGTRFTRRSGTLIILAETA